MKVVTTANLNVRRNAGTTYPIVKTLRKGTVINVQGSKKVGNTIWYNIGTNQWVSSNYTTTVSNNKQHEIVVNPKMSINQIQDCLKKSGCTIRFSAGIYNITKTLLLYSDTKIYLDNATLVRKNPKQIFMNYLNPNTQYNYNATKNVKIYGTGKLKGNGNTKTCSTISLMHCDNISFEGIEFVNTYRSHAVDLAGCSNVLFKNVTFRDRIDNTDKYYKEEINIDMSYYSGFPYYPMNAQCFNNNHCKNITFDNVEFIRINTCIGNHTETSTLKKHENITIKNCKATGCGKGIFVDLVNANNVSIMNNICSGFMRGIVIDALDRYYNARGTRTTVTPTGKSACNNVRIADNKISDAKGTVKASGIYIISQSDLRHQNINISNNTILLNNSYAKYDIYIGNAENVVLENNKTKLEVRIHPDSTKAVNIK